MTAPTIGERLTACRQKLTLALAAAKADEIMSYKDLLAAIADVTGDALEQVYWIEQCLPDDLRRTPAPTDDQRAEEEEAAGAERQEA